MLNTTKVFSMLCDFRQNETNCFTPVPQVASAMLGVQKKQKINRTQDISPLNEFYFLINYYYILVMNM